MKYAKHTAKITVVALIALFSAQAPAETAIEKCTAISSLAGTVELARQAGVTAAQVMGVAKPDFEEVMKIMVEESYGGPRYSTPQYQQRAITEAENRWFLLCMKSG